MANDKPLPPPRGDLTQLAIRLRDHAEKIEWRMTLARLHEDRLAAAKVVEEAAAQEDDDAK
jgi:hypothetical protein